MNTLPFLTHYKGVVGQMECCVEPVYKVSSKFMITRNLDISKTISCQQQPLLYSFFPQTSEISGSVARVSPIERLITHPRPGSVGM